MAAPPPSAWGLIMQTTGAFYRSKCLHLAAKHRVADQLENGPRSAEELAAPDGVRSQELRRVLRCLVQIGIFVEDGDGKFANNEASEFLRRSHPASCAPLVLHWVGELMPATGHLDDTLVNGGSAFERVYGMPVFDWYTKNPENEKNFSLVMSGTNTISLQGVLASKDWRSLGAVTIADIGGSRGTLLRGLLAANPEAKGVLFDLPSVIEIARREEPEYQPGGAFHDRVQLVGGNFFESVPVADVYIMRMILHDWSDDDCIRILKTIRRSIPKHGVLFNVDMQVYGPGEIKSDDMQSLSLDITMLTVFGSARERTREEFNRLFEASGFALKGVTKFSPVAALWEAAPVDTA